MIFFDTHIHLQNMPDMTPELLKISGVGGCICVSAKISDWPMVASWAQKAPKTVVPAFAVHPWYVNGLPSGWAYELEKYLQKYPTALVGECGFDRLRNPDYDVQAQVFDTHIDLAKKYHRALLIHAVKSWLWLEDYWQKLPEKFVFHSFNARMEQLKQILRYGGYVAVNKSVFKNKDAESILRFVPLQRLLLETDAPFQSLPSDLETVCQRIAEIRQEKLEIVTEVLYNNAMELIKNDE